MPDKPSTAAGYAAAELDLVRQTLLYVATRLGDVSAYSGLLHLRVPKRLHQALAQEARADGVSLNAAATALLAAGLGVEATVRRRGRPAGAKPVSTSP